MFLCAANGGPQLKAQFFRANGDIGERRVGSDANGKILDGLGMTSGCASGEPVLEEICE
jgi:hypothetical protein